MALPFRRARPLLNRILVEVTKPVTQTKSGILLPEGKGTKLNYAKVLEVGPGKRDDSGKHIPVTLKQGDFVLIPEYGGTKVILSDKEELYLYREDDILAVLDEAV